MNAAARVSLDGQVERVPRFIVQADENLSAFVELER
jgi:hypothetical protein